ncbi:MAG: 16S rRNA (cytidine(1402)-2'-O)-methyltransferase [Clostridia bacterium]|nr:16S rRNA (cytidine(1402)-2'-O)-methyltransferase [Clostridia bacterium]
MEPVNEKGTGMLILVATPIGNLGDMSPRGIDTLASADAIAAEDTRTAALLLQKFGITGKRMIPNHKFNEAASAGKLIAEMQSGAKVALVTDAGMPCISDPGYLLVREAAAAGIPVTAVPGCCAAVTAVAVSGFNALSFTFYGFLPRTPGEIRNVFLEMAKARSPLTVYYESPRRIVRTLEILRDTRPADAVCLCNDLTKQFERIYRGSAEEVFEELSANPNAEKGEYVLLVNRPEAAGPEEEPAVGPEGWIADRMIRFGESARDAVAALAGEASCPYGKKELYDASLRIKHLLDSGEADPE